MYRRHLAGQLSCCHEHTSIEGEDERGERASKRADVEKLWGEKKMVGSEIDVFTWYPKVTKKMFPDSKLCLKFCGSSIEPH